MSLPKKFTRADISSKSGDCKDLCSLGLDHPANQRVSSVELSLRGGTGFDEAAPALCAIGRGAWRRSDTGG